MHISIFRKNYTEANLKLQNTNKEKYDLATIYMCSSEMHKGFVVDYIKPTTKDGTTVKYKLCSTIEEALLYRKYLEELLEQYNEKYKTHLTLDSLDQHSILRMWMFS